MAKEKEFSVQRDCTNHGAPIIAISMTGLIRGMSDGEEAYLAWSCAQPGSIAKLADKLHALADDVEALSGQEGGLWSMPWEKP